MPAGLVLLEPAFEPVLELLAEPLLAAVPELLLGAPFEPAGAGAVCWGVKTGVAAGAALFGTGMVDSPASGSEVAGAAMMVVGVPSIRGDCTAGSVCSIGMLAGIAVSDELRGGKIG